MKTDEGLQYFLSNETITDHEYAELVKHYFQADKTDWYQQNGTEKQWDELKVKQFWHLIRKHHMHFCKKRKVYYFRKFVFPAFETTTNPYNYDDIILNGDFWEEDKERVFCYGVDFQGAIFLSNVMLSEIIFQKYVNLSHTIFSEEAHFKMCVFTQDVLMERASFKANVNFASSQFKGQFLAYESEFLQNVFFRGAKFEDLLDIDNVLFSHVALFQRAEFNKTIVRNLMNKPELDFRNAVLPASLIFRRVNLTNTIFTQSDVAEVQFKECDWGEASRIVLRDEQQEDKTIGHYAGLEEIYRQLKKNFDGNKDWELSGKAYVSEMEMRKKRLWKQGDYFHWLIYAFYDVFGGYTQNLKKPIFWLFRLIVVFSCIYYPIDQSVQWAIQRGIYGALPKLITIDIPEELQFSGYWLIALNIETILGSTFLVFFILALRKRFKQ
ncbi:pentapeptide repeat-containing protein [Aquimarina macrocephali]|uniref:pentapeptide repeat-containing protein n=1 Tax=Aquimarina macrocephali TaxID=666563 RepID=UPI00046522C5|nr:pentapeptide repeat-containing protein [Aquimarina macrocephali]